MKKSLTYSLILGASLILSSALTIIVNNTTAVNNNSNSENLLAIDSNLSTENSLNLTSKNETVYIMTDENGSPNKTFIGNVLNTANEPLPLELKISYFLNGSEISTTDLAGKSGHLKIVYNYTSLKSYNQKLVPFLTITGLSLDSTKIKNLKVNNGKIISETENTLIVGYAFAGLNEDLNTDLLPETFVVEADVTNFSLGTTYTLATNEIFAEIDTSKLNSIDNLIDSINDLSAGLDKIISGASELSDGTTSLASGLVTVQTGVDSLNNGSSALAAGASELSTGLNTLAENSDALVNGAAGTFNIFLNQTETSINTNQTLAYLIMNYGTSFGLTYPVSLSIDNYDHALGNIISLINYVGGDPSEIETAKTSLNSYDNFYTGLITYTTGVDSAAIGASKLSTGATSLASGTTELKTGVDTLVAGAEKLSSGMGTLKDGLNTFKSEGINKLVNFANNDLNSFLYNFRSTITAAKNYHSYANSSATSVEFIFKTPSIK